MNQRVNQLIISFLCAQFGLEHITQTGAWLEEKCIALPVRAHTARLYPVILAGGRLSVFVTTVGQDCRCGFTLPPSCVTIILVSLVTVVNGYLGYVLERLCIISLIRGK